MRDIYLKKLEASNDSDVQSFLAITNDPEVEKFVNYLQLKVYAKNTLILSFHVLHSM